MTKKQSVPRDSALPRKRSAGALSLQDARHRQRVVPDKRARIERDQHRRDMKHPRTQITRVVNTLCPKIGAAQWSCTKKECTCHLKERIAVKDHCRFDSGDEYNCTTQPCFLCFGPGWS